MVGVIADTRNDGLRAIHRAGRIYNFTRCSRRQGVLALRTEGAAHAAARARTHPDHRPQSASAARLRSKTSLVSETVQPRFNMALFTFFGLLGLGARGAGIYSMLSYSVARRNHEIRIRLALGANRNNVLSLMLAMGGKLVLID